jgi:hypothetical protein
LRALIMLCTQGKLLISSLVLSAHFSVAALSLILSADTQNSETQI